MTFKRRSSTKELQLYKPLSKQSTQKQTIFYDDATESVKWVPTYKLDFCVHQFVLLIWWNFYSTMVYKIHIIIIIIIIIIYNAICVDHNKPYHKNIQSFRGTAKIILICVILRPQIFPTVRSSAAGWKCRTQIKMHYENSSSCSPRKKSQTVCSKQHCW